MRGRWGGTGWRQQQAAAAASWDVLASRLAKAQVKHVTNYPLSSSLVHGAGRPAAASSRRGRHYVTEEGAVPPGAATLTPYKERPRTPGRPATHGTLPPPPPSKGLNGPLKTSSSKTSNLRPAPPLTTRAPATHPRSLALPGRALRLSVSLTGTTRGTAAHGLTQRAVVPSRPLPLAAHDSHPSPHDSPCFSRAPTPFAVRGPHGGPRGASTQRVARPHSLAPLVL